MPFRFLPTILCASIGFLSFSPVIGSYTFETIGNTPSSYEPSSGVLIHSNGYYYGTNRIGGDQGVGSIYKMDADGSNYHEIYHFGNNELRNPWGPLQSDDNLIYGIANGGEGNTGTIFSINPDGSDFRLLHAFAPEDGTIPTGLLLLNEVLYGTTRFGGNGENGTLFKLNTIGSNFQTLHLFSGSDGTSPNGLVAVGDLIYGTCSSGGSNQTGTLFKMAISGEGFEVLHHFAEAHSPVSPPLTMNTVLYGTARTGFSSGILYSINNDGTQFQIQHSFNSPEESMPTGPLAQHNGLILGTTIFGGNNNLGYLFQFDPGLTQFTKLHDFDELEYENLFFESSGVPVITGSLLLGSSPNGGGSGRGTIFQYNLENETLKVLRSFDIPDRLIQVGQMVERDGWIYGTNGERPGGNDEWGSIFRVRVTGEDYTILHQFGAFEDGLPPEIGLVESLGILYGSTRGGSDNEGTIFSFDPENREFKVIYKMNGEDGRRPPGQRCGRGRAIRSHSSPNRPIRRSRFQD